MASGASSVWLCGWTTFPPCTSAKGMLNRLEKKTGRKSWACHAPALALSHMRLQVPPGWSLKSLSRGSCLGLPTLGFIWVSHGSRQGGTHPPRTPLLRKDLPRFATKNGPPGAALYQAGIAGLCLPLSAHPHLPGMLGLATSSSTPSRLPACTARFRMVRARATS